MFIEKVKFSQFTIIPIGQTYSYKLHYYKKLQF